jgi:hypothetical protein
MVYISLKLGYAHCSISLFHIVHDASVIALEVGMNYFSNRMANYGCEDISFFYGRLGK